MMKYNSFFTAKIVGHIFGSESSNHATNNKQSRGHCPNQTSTFTLASLNSPRLASSSAPVSFNFNLISANWPSMLSTLSKFNSSFSKLRPFSASSICVSFDSRLSIQASNLTIQSFVFKRLVEKLSKVVLYKKLLDQRSGKICGAYIVAKNKRRSCHCDTAQGQVQRPFVQKMVNVSERVVMVNVSERVVMVNVSECVVVNKIIFCLF
ncbi:hypothetical protein BpHYR1_040152 [Brachionus plicatilis]|uniref:Uncharacterized protein n=1 Tax=Brachionus plicatilis TaxID=10195 RepID=A0A3M7SJM4_BRAPC|nr:hypothetical protein BpHYR1_040152 [Brachionus plicatilis]